MSFFSSILVSKISICVISVGAVISGVKKWLLSVKNDFYNYIAAVNVLSCDT